MPGWILISTHWLVNLFQYFASDVPPMIYGWLPGTSLKYRIAEFVPGAVIFLFMLRASCECTQISFGLSRALSQKLCSAASISTMPFAPSEVSVALSRLL